MMMPAPFMSAQYEVKTVLLDRDTPLDPDQLQESPGVYQVSPEERKAHFYCPDACLPLDQWRTLTGEIIQDGARIEPCNPIATVGLFNLPASLKQSLRQFMHAYAHNRPNNVMANPALVALRAQAKQYLCERFPGPSPVRDMIGIAQSPPGLPTVTVDRKQGWLPGLHYDSWQSASLAERSIANARIAVNLGLVPRWFLYVPVGLPSLLQALAATDNGQNWTSETPILGIKDALLWLNPPVLCLKLNPGQGYIAPTESVIHDATTRWASQPSYNFQLMGNFQWLTQSPHQAES
jgi:hypothetical protein